MSGNTEGAQCSLKPQVRLALENLVRPYGLKSKTFIVYAGLEINLSLYDDKRSEIENNFRILSSNDPIFIIQLNQNDNCIFDSYRRPEGT